MLFFSVFNKDQIEKCSESIGINEVLYFKSSLFKNFQPQIIDSLFAIAKFFENFIIFKDGSSPSIPEIAFIVKKDLFFFNLNTSSIELNTLIFFF